eukprot:5730409-Prymnesium_polylepis.1
MESTHWCWGGAGPPRLAAPECGGAVVAAALAAPQHLLAVEPDPHEAAGALDRCHLLFGLLLRGRRRVVLGAGNLRHFIHEAKYAWSCCVPPVALDPWWPTVACGERDPPGGRWPMLSPEA